MSEFTPFLQQTYPLDLLQQRARLVEGLARYVTGDWRDVYKGTEDPRAAEFRASVKSAMFDVFSQHFDIPKRVRASMRDPGDTNSLVLKAFSDVVDATDEESLCTPHFSDEALVKAFSKRFKTSVVNLGDEAKPSVLGAFQMACDSYRQATTRRAALQAITLLVTTNEYSGCPNLTHLGDLFSHLYERKSYFMRNMLVFSGLLGGQAHTQTIKLAAREMCHKEDPEDIQYSVMHFLTTDGRHPGIYHTKTHDEFVTDIRDKYDAL